MRHPVLGVLHQRVGHNLLLVTMLPLAVFLSISVSCLAQTFNMNMDQQLTPWNPCVEPTCDPGGSGIPNSYSIFETGLNWPTTSLGLSMTGPAWTNFLVWDKVGATDAGNFNSDFWAYIPAGYLKTAYQALEYDIFAYNAPYRFMFGSQCVIDAKWQIWDELHKAWLDTILPCALTFGAWHHIQWWVHRVSGDTSCDGYPCMYYDMLGIDGGYTLFGTKEPAGPIPSGWSNDSGLNFQLDRSAVAGTLSVGEYIRKVNFVEN